MAKNLYITTTEARSGKSAIALGVMEVLLRNIGKVAFFRPIIQGTEIRDKVPDRDLYLFAQHFDLHLSFDEMYAFTTEQANELISLGKHDALMEGILSKYKALEQKFDFVLCEGTDFDGLTSAFEFDINADIANTLGAPVLLVIQGKGKELNEMVSSTRVAIESFRDKKGCTILGAFINRVEWGDLEEVHRELREALPKAHDYLLYAIPENETLGNPTMQEVAQSLQAEILFGEDRLYRTVRNYRVGAMQIDSFLKHLQRGSLVITSGDRTDLILSSLLSLKSMTLPSIAGLILTGGMKPKSHVQKLFDGLGEISIPILSVPFHTFETVQRLNEVRAGIFPQNKRKIATVLKIFEHYVDIPKLRSRIVDAKPTRMSPKMFEYGLIQRAREQRQKIVLPEGLEDRILYAAEILYRREVVDLVLLGNVREVMEKISRLGLDLREIEIIDPMASPHFEDYVQTYYELRKHKGINEEIARDVMRDLSYFGTMMVYKGHADGMVSGAVHTTRHTLRPAFEFIRTKPGNTIVSSVFFMCLEDRVLVYGDCAINPRPTAEQLAEIAICSAKTSRVFGIEPRVAMLSYSTGSSGVGSEVERVAKATALAKQRCPNLLIEGPIQYDAAIDPGVAKTKMPNSQVAGKATVFIFPDLNTGNNTYKAVQRSANAIAVGPVLQGLNKPVNDLSRGCTVTDIVNTVAITAIQAQAEKKARMQRENKS